MAGGVNMDLWVECPRCEGTGWEDGCEHGPRAVISHVADCGSRKVWQCTPFLPASPAEVLAYAATLDGAEFGQPIWRCEKHQSEFTKGAAGEVCQAAINIAYRMGRNPFDRITCRMVEGVWVPTGKETDR